MNALQIAPGTCNACGLNHSSNQEICIYCGLMIKDCNLNHTMELDLSFEGIVKSPNIDTLLDIIFFIKNKYKTENFPRKITAEDIFKEGDRIFQEKGINLPEKILSDLKHIVKQREFREVYSRKYLEISSCFKIEEEEIINPRSLKESIDEDEEKYPFKLKMGVFLTWCGGAMCLLPNPAVKYAGKAVTTYASSLVVEGLTEHWENKDKKAKEKAEKQKIKDSKKKKREKR